MGVMLKNRTKKPEAREFTFMIVPHHGQGVVRKIHIPIKAIQWIAGTLCVLILVVSGLFCKCWHAAGVAKAEQAELENLRQSNGSKAQQIAELTKMTVQLQQDMGRLNKLDADIRRIVASDQSTPVSRGGIVRPAVSGGEVYTGQGGPNSDVQDLIKTTGELQVAAKAREQSLTDLKQALIEKNLRSASIPSIWPAAGTVTSRFGYRSSPWGGGSDFHPGIDIANAYGTPIAAAADGEVVQASWDGGYGNMVEINHGNGLVSIYGHTQQMIVKVGDKVKKGQVIAYMGSTGLSTGPHVHYEIRENGTAVDPAKYL